MTDLIPYVRIVDDDEALLRSMRLFLDANSIPVRTYQDPRDFLTTDSLFVGGCIVLDVRMPRMSGFEVFHELLARDVTLPVVFLSAHGDIETAVTMVKQGAFHFIEKPVAPDVFLRWVREAMQEDIRRRERILSPEEAKTRFARLTEREQETVVAVVRGLSNRQIAKQLGLSERTVENYRLHAYSKLEVNSVSGLGDFFKALPLDSLGKEKL